MFSIGPLGFVTPWLLVPLVALPILWILLRAVPPAPIRRRFPGVALLLGLKDDEAETDKTPWCSTARYRDSKPETPLMHVPRCGKCWTLRTKR